VLSPVLSLCRDTSAPATSLLGGGAAQALSQVLVKKLYKLALFWKKKKKKPKLLFIYFLFAVLGFELRVYTLSHFTNPFL
jgi:hypothetical protein